MSNWDKGVAIVPWNSLYIYMYMTHSLELCRSHLHWSCECMNTRCWQEHQNFLGESQKKSRCARKKEWENRKWKMGGRDADKNIRVSLNLLPSMHLWVYTTFGAFRNCRTITEISFLSTSRDFPRCGFNMILWRILCLWRKIHSRNSCEYRKRRIYGWI